MVTVSAGSGLVVPLGFQGAVEILMSSLLV